MNAPVYAEGDTIDEPSETPGGEWSGEIPDPEPAPQPAPTPEPVQPAPAPEPVQPTPTTPSKPAPKTVATPVQETPAETPAKTTEPAEAPTEEPKEETENQEENTELTPVEAPEVPKTHKKAESDNDFKTKIITLLSATVTIFVIVIIWGIYRFYQIAKYEKIYKDALKKSREVKKSGITRAG